MKKTVASLIFTTLFFYSCQNKPEAFYYNKEVINILANDNFEGDIPPPPRPDMYVKTEGDSICKTQTRFLYEIYKSDYTNEYNEFASFLFDALNQKKAFIIHTSVYAEECFKLNKEVTKAYHNLSLKDFLNKYCIPISNGNNVYKFKNEVKHYRSYLNSVSYYLFLHNYTVSLDCMTGEYYIRPFELYYK